MEVWEVKEFVSQSTRPYPPLRRRWVAECKAVDAGTKTAAPEGAAGVPKSRIEVGDRKEAG